MQGVAQGAAMTKWVMATLTVPSQPALSGPRFEPAAPRVHASSSSSNLPLILSSPLPSHDLAFVVVIIDITIASVIIIITIIIISAKRGQKQREG